MLGNKQRIASIDILRGLVVVVMALDHIRDIFALTPTRPELMSPLEPGWFFTRWITHFCAPVFVFLAGTAAFLYGAKINDKPALSRFLIVRGIWLIIIEITVVNLSWTFSLPTTAGFVILQVIWAIGWAMILLAGLIWLPTPVILGFGLALCVGHNALDSIEPESWGAFDWLWKLIHAGNSWIPVLQDPPLGLVVLYPLIPWIGVMAIGYAFGPVLKWEADRQRRFLLIAGSVLTLVFIVFRFTNVYGNPAPFERGDSFVESLMNFLNTEKYPPSLLFLAMTLGLALLLLVPLEGMRGKLGNALAVFGKVPFFFYVLHMPLLTLLGALWFKIRYGQAMILLTTPVNDLPEEYEPNLLLVYAVWIPFTVFMYYACRWFGRLKATRDDWWLKYL